MLKILYLFLIVCILGGCTSVRGTKTMQKTNSPENIPYIEQMEALFKAYQNENLSDFLDMVHTDAITIDLSGNRLNYNMLQRSLRDDFQILNSIYYQVLVTGIRQETQDGRIRIDLRWERRASLSRSNQEWVLRDQSSTLFFDASTKKLLMIQGGPLFGLSNTDGKMIIRQGMINGQTITNTLIVGLAG